MNRWQLLQELFEATLGLDATDRSRAVRERTDGDEELARSLEALLAADARPLESLGRTATDVLRELRDEPPAQDLCGASFGPYRVDEHLSSGGMAHVYRATRTSAGTERRVALKVLRPGLDTAAFLERFRRERETLAALEHEHVVSFLDAGALPDGRPYLVMEYVEGAALTEWGRSVPLRERLELFLKVLAAVQYAHQELLVHRDLKPSNVLVTAQGIPKLLDFGVATMLPVEAADAHGRAPLTPTYASPEQVRGERLTTASDVFSLGVMLHELAFGELPPDDPNGKRAPRRDADLAAIVRRSLAPDPAGRYRSADNLAHDLRRHLAREPVSARSPTWGYRASLFAVRNRWPLAFASAVVLATAAGWIGSDLDRRRAQSEASMGWGAHAQSKVVARLFEEWMSAVTDADPELSVSAAAHLEQALAERLAALPEAETLVRLALARLYLQRGETDRASEHAERAWELAQTTRGVGEIEQQRAERLRRLLRDD